MALSTDNSQELCDIVNDISGLSKKLVKFRDESGRRISLADEAFLQIALALLEQVLKIIFRIGRCN